MPREDVKQQFAELRARGQKIVCVIVEPILSEGGGDLHAPRRRSSASCAGSSATPCECAREGTRELLACELLAS